MSPLSNANYRVLCSVMYRIESGKCIRINEAGINKRIGKKRENVFNKKFRWNGVNLSVQSRNLFPYKKYLINKALKLSAASL